MRLSFPKLRARCFAVALLVVLAAFLVRAVSAQENPENMDPDANKNKAKQLLNLAVQAMGGSAYRNQSQSDCGGRVAKFDRNGGTLGYSIMRTYWQYPDKNRTEYVVKTTKGGMFAILWGNLPVKGGEFIQLFDGDKGWTMDKSGVNDADVSTVEEFQAGLKRQIRNLLLNRANEQDVFLYYAGIGVSDMREVDWIDFNDNDERKVRLALDHQSHLPMRTVSTTPNEEMHDRDEDVAIYSNYKEHEGVQSPQQVTREHNGMRTHQIFYDTCSNSPNLPADFFTEASLQKKFKDTGGKVKAEK